MHVDPRRVEAAAQRQRELAAGGDVAGDPLLGEHAVDRRAGKRLGGEQHVEVLRAGAERLDERLRAGAQVVLDDDVGRRAELAGELDGVAAAELQAAVLVDAAADRIGLRELGAGRRHADRRVCKSDASRAGRRRRSARTTGSPTRCVAPAEPPRGGVVILHGAGSCKENHLDFARAVRARRPRRDRLRPARPRRQRGRARRRRARRRRDDRRRCCRRGGRDAPRALSPGVLSRRQRLPVAHRRLATAVAVVRLHEEDLDGDVGVVQVVAEERLDGAAGEALDRGDEVVAHRVLKGAAHREHLGRLAAIGERALGLREAVAQRHDDRVGADRRPRARRAAAGVVVQQPDDGVGDRGRQRASGARVGCWRVLRGCRAWSPLRSRPRGNGAAREKGGEKRPASRRRSSVQRSAIPAGRRGSSQRR